MQVKKRNSEVIELISNEGWENLKRNQMDTAYVVVSNELDCNKEGKIMPFEVEQIIKANKKPKKQ